MSRSYSTYLFLMCTLSFLTDNGGVKSNSTPKPKSPGSIIQEVENSIVTIRKHLIASGRQDELMTMLFNFAQHGINTKPSMRKALSKKQSEQLCQYFTYLMVLPTGSNCSNYSVKADGTKEEVFDDSSMNEEIDKQYVDELRRSYIADVLQNIKPTYSIMIKWIARGFVDFINPKHRKWPFFRKSQDYNQSQTSAMLGLEMLLRKYFPNVTAPTTVGSLDVSTTIITTELTVAVTNTTTASNTTKLPAFWETHKWKLGGVGVILSILALGVLYEWIRQLGVTPHICTPPPSIWLQPTSPILQSSHALDYGLIAGGIVLLALLAIAYWYYCYKGQRQTPEPESSTVLLPSSGASSDVQENKRIQKNKKHKAVQAVKQPSSVASSAVVSNTAVTSEQPSGVPGLTKMAANNNNKSPVKLPENTKKRKPAGGQVEATGNKARTKKADKGAQKK